MAISENPIFSLVFFGSLWLNKFIIPDFVSFVEKITFIGQKFVQFEGFSCAVGSDVNFLVQGLICSLEKL